MKLNQERNTAKLQILLRIYGVLTLVLFTVLLAGSILQIQEFNPGGNLHWLIWDEVSDHAAPMLFIIYFIWGIYFFVAARNPAKNSSFLDFTMWANLGHGILMIPMALTDTMYHVKFLTDIPFVFLLAIGIYVWRPSTTEQSA